MIVTMVHRYKYLDQVEGGMTVANVQEVGMKVRMTWQLSRPLSAMHLYVYDKPHGVAGFAEIEIPLNGQVETVSLVGVEALLSFDDWGDG